MDKNGNKYTLLYASVMVIVVAVLLAGASTMLKPFQDANILIETKQNILRSVRIIAAPGDANDLFDKTIKEMYIVNSKGVRMEGDAFRVNLKTEHKKMPEHRKLPVYVARIKEIGDVYIFPLRGTGLWGPVWGYISLLSDLKTIYGATFDHQGETPGLGAEINSEHFQKPFEGKTIFDSTGIFTGIKVAKTGEKSDYEHRVDAISGGTITSKAVEKMVYDDLAAYQEFFKTLKK